MELDDTLYNTITTLCRDGDLLAEQGASEEALKKFSSAWALLPEPKHDWEAATWILGTIADVLFKLKHYSEAKDVLTEALRCPSGLGNAFIHLRLGETFYELGDMEKSNDELARAYMAGGKDVFVEEDPKYFLSLSKVLKPPPGEESI